MDWNHQRSMVRISNARNGDNVARYVRLDGTSYVISRYAVSSNGLRVVSPMSIGAGRTNVSPGSREKSRWFLDVISGATTRIVSRELAIWMDSTLDWMDMGIRTRGARADGGDATFKCI